jgi:chromate reductase
MPKVIRVLGISGSLRKGSYNTALLRTAATIMPVNSALQIFDISQLPLFNQDNEKPPHLEVAKLKAALTQSDAVLLASPEYNYSVPGVLKNAIDCASRPYGENSWNGKPVVVITSSIDSVGGARVQVAWKPVFAFLNMPCMPGAEFALSVAQQKIDKDGNLTDEATKKFLAQVLSNFINFARLFPEGPAKAKF